MATGLAAALLVFTGLWHAFEWMMGGRNQDTLRLIPVGSVYAVLGWLIAIEWGGMAIQLIALVVTCAGLAAALSVRKTAEIRPWVLWAFIVIDVVVILALVLSFFG